MSKVDQIRTAGEAGFRMPAEWEPHERCWMQWPGRDDFIWADLNETQLAYARVANAVRRFEPLAMIVSPDSLQEARGKCGDGIDYLVMELDDSWARDSGPNFVKRGDELAASVYHFAAWGQKYPHFRNDAAVGHRIAEHLAIPTFTANVFMEGGGINVDGEGTILTSESCILNENRNPGLTRSEAEQILCDSLGGDKVIWVPGDPADLETDGHIDGVACFVRPGVVLCETGSPDDPGRCKDLRENLSALEKASDAAGRNLEIITIAEAHDADATSDRFCRSYINFYIANGGIVFPSYGTACDVVAIETVQAAFPDHEIATVDINAIAEGGGGIHCITQQQPI
jgi:agmatine deiminase